MSRAAVMVCVGLSLATPPRPGQARETAANQIVVVRGLKKKQVAVELVPGDHVATLAVTDPPERLIQILESQLGPFLVAVERIERIDRTLRVALHLSTDAVVVRLDRLRAKKARAISLTFTSGSNRPRVVTETLIGRIPDSPPKLPWPVVLPSVPRRHPCARFDQVNAVARSFESGAGPTLSSVLAFTLKIPDEHCRDFFLARLAAHRLKSNESPTDLKVWAFKFSQQDRWGAYAYAYSYTALVASAVLLREGYHPEAEALLGTDRIQTSKKLVPYRALMLSDLMSAKGDRGTAQQILRALTKTGPSPSIRDAVVIRLLDSASQDGERSASSILDELTPLMARRSPFEAEAALRSGELALVANRPKEALAHFRRAADSDARRIRSHAFLRLGDLALRRRINRTSRRRALEHYRRVHRHDRCLFAMVKLRRVLFDTRDRELLEKNVVDIIADPQCDGQSLEARYAMAELSMTRDQFDYAMQLVDGATEELHDRASSRLAFRALSARISREAVGRLYRNRDWPGLAELYQDHLIDRRDTLSPSVLLLVADALNRVGLHDAAASLIRDALKKTKDAEDLERLTLALAKSYLMAEKHYLAEVVLEYFRRVRSRSEMIWSVQLVRAELLLRQNDPKAALDALMVADKSTPGGDPRTRLHLLRAEAEYRLGRADASASSLIRALRGTWHPSLEKRGRGVNVLSLCVRKCSPGKLERLLNMMEKSGDEALISERVRYLSTKRGIGPKPELNDTSVWQRLDTAVPGARFAPRADARR